MSETENKIKAAIEASKAPPPDEGKKFVSAADLLNVEDVLFEDVDISKWHGEGAIIRLKSLSAKEAFTFINTSSQNEGMIQIVVKSAVDENGDLLFTENQAEALKRKSFGMFAKIQKAAMVLNGLREPEIRAAIKNG